MKKIITLLVLIIQSINLFSQPGDKEKFYNQSAYSEAFLHCVTDEKYFANYAIEARTSSFELMDVLKCKLHVPAGFNKIWKDLEKSNFNKLGEFDYSKDSFIGLRFNFYIGGVMVSNAFKKVEKTNDESGSFTYYFDLNPLDFGQSLGELNSAYIELLKNLKNKGRLIVIQAALASKTINSNNYLPFANSNFYMLYDDLTHQKWMKSSINYNIQLKKMGDSTMKRIFGELGFLTNFAMTCFQNPCAKGYMYSNTLESNNPCSSEPQDSCKEAIITYKFIKKDIPFTIKMLITIKENAGIVYIENNSFGFKEINIEKQKLLSSAEIQKIISEKFQKDSLVILPDNKALSYSSYPIQIRKPISKDEGQKINSHSGSQIIKITKAGKKWESGFIYYAYSKNPKKSNQIYQFDAVTGALLCVFEISKVTN